MAVPKCQSLKGATCILLSDYIKDNKAVINVQNNDNKCFMRALLSALHPANDPVDRVSKYKVYQNELNFDIIKFPVSAKYYPN